MNLQERFKKAGIDRDNDNVELALKEYVEISKEALIAGERELAADCLHMSGISYSHIENYPKAEEFFQKAQQEFESLNSKMKVGAVLRDRGSIAVAQGDLKQAEELTQQSIDILSQTEFPGHAGMSKVKLGVIYSKQKENAKAELKILEGIKDIQKSNDKWFESTAYFNLAEIQKDLGKVNEAKNSLNKSLEIINQIANLEEHSRRRQKIEKLQQELDSKP